MSAMQTRTGTLLQLSLFFKLAFAARQPYDAHKIIDAFRQPHDDLTMICAHRGQRYDYHCNKLNIQLTLHTDGMAQQRTAEMPTFVQHKLESNALRPIYGYPQTATLL